MTRASKKEREQFVAAMARELPAGWSAEAVAAWCGKIMRLGATHGRLAEAVCNGDYPADGPWADDDRMGRKSLAECGECGGHWARSQCRTHGPGGRYVCPDCRNEAAIRGHCKAVGMEPVFGGDPRGATVKIRVPSGRTNDWGRIGICVPTS